MEVTLRDIMREMPARRRKVIEKRAAELIAEYMTLTDLRRARRLTQRRLAATLGIGQEGVSRLEKRSDLLLSTLGSYIEAMGGKLRLVAEFPDRPPVVLERLVEADEEPRARRRRAAGAQARRKPAARSRRK